MAGQHCGLTAHFSIFDAEDCLQILRSLVSENLGQDRKELEQVQQQISFWKSELLRPDDVPSSANHLAAKNLYQHYETTLRAYNAVDFDDLIVRPVQLLQQNTEVREKWQNRWRYLLVDEYWQTICIIDTLIEIFIKI